MKKSLTSNKTSVILNDKEYALIKLLREIKYGQVIIYLENGVPVRIEKIKESMKL